MNDYRHITVRPDGWVAELVLDRPEAHNALSTAMAREIADATARAGRRTTPCAWSS